MNLIRHVAVVIPAADEEAHIGACLSSVRIARAELHRTRPDVSVDVVVVLDCCTDDTATIAHQAGARTVDCIARRVGVARQLGTQDALAARTEDPVQIWLANTDADSQVPVDWLTSQLELADQGADLVLGTVRPDAVEPVMSRWRLLHSDTDGHSHVHGANLGIRAGVITALGGWPPLATGEDVALVACAKAIGACVVSSGRHSVTTSARRVGRAPKGFSSFLAALDD